MPAWLGVLLYVGLIVYLFRQDRREYGHVSGALWIALVWMTIVGTKNPSLWLSLKAATSSQQAYEDGNLFDRLIYLALIIASVVALRHRSVDWKRLFGSNLPLVAVLGYCLASVLWSDFPFVALKRWFRDLGIYLTILVAVTDATPVDAVCLLFRRFAYMTLLLSVAFIKYLPQVGTGNSPWTGQKLYMGVTTGKNSLGALCLISGLFFVWDTLRRWEKPDRNMRLIAINLAMIAVGQWLLNLSSSATALICLIFGTALLVVGRLGVIRRNPRRIVWLLVVGALIMVPLNMAFDFSSGVFSAAGRDATLTGRTDLWDSIRKMELHPVFGFGYESFWLGKRLEYLWALHPWRPNQAHNGYFEAYLNVGWVGVALVLVYVFATLLKLKNRLRVEFMFTMLALTYLCSLLFYNYTEASLLKWHVHWYAFLVLAIGTASIPAVARESVGSKVVIDKRRAFARFSTPSAKAPQRRVLDTEARSSRSRGRV